MLQHKQVPPNLHLSKLNPNIDLSNFSCVMPDKVLPWASASACSGVSSFGFSGTNSHVNVQEAPQAELEAVLASLTERPVMKWTRTDLSYRDWAQQLWWGVSWQPFKPAETATPSAEEWLVVGDGADFLAKVGDVVPKATAVGLQKLASEKEVDQLLSRTWSTVVFAGLSSEPSLEGPTLAALLRLVQGLAKAGKAVRFLVLTAGAQSAAGDIGRGVLGAAVWGFVRSLRLELPLLQLKTVDLSSDLAELETELRAAGTWPSDEEQAAEAAEVAYIQGERCVPRLRLAPVPPGSAQLEASGSQLISGGFGGLGLSIAQELVDIGAKTLILVSRSGKTPAGDEKLQQMFQALSSSSATVHAWSCDVADAAKTKEMLQKARSLDAPLKNVVHAAGIIDFCEVTKLTVEGMNSVFKPKVSGAWNLHSGSSSDAKTLNSFVLFSSVSSLIGLSSGVTYSASNAYLDGLSLWRRAEGLAASSLQWGPVADVGMAAKGDSALKLISPKHVRNAFQRVLAKPSLPHQLLFARKLEDIVLGVAQGVLGEMLESEAPLMESGLDSLSAVDFRNQVAKQLPGLKLPNTLMFDYPSPQAIAKYAAAQLAPAAAPAAAPARLASADERGPLATLGSACRFPLGEDCETFWAALVQKTDGVTEIPYERWDVDEYYDPSPNAVGRMYVRHAAFIQNAESFDAAMFSISGAEAASMDPQQRILLEIVQEGFHAAKAWLGVGGASSPLSTKDIGSFVGECNNDWGHFKNLETDKMNPFSGTGGSMSISSNRLAYVFGFRGPSVTSDTACSSSLVALDMACANIGRNRCSAAVSAGVNMNLLPGPFVACCQAKMLSEGGRCKTFDASADGYSRGEGAGTVLVRRLKELEDVALCSVAGTAANQDGRSSSLTAPNGPAQQQVILTAWQEAGASPGSGDYIETHGTGTGLGDPIEVGALCSTMGQGRSSTLYVGAVKSNISHLEGAAGIAGLLKALHAMEKRQVPPNLHLASLNPHIDVEDVDISFPTESLVELSQESLRSFGLSSFGFGGTNTHVSAFAPTEKEAKAEPQEKIVFNRQRFSWSQTKHPLSVQSRRGEPGVTVFAAPIKGKVLQLLSHHIIYGEIVVPGATYIEMVIATSAFRLDMANKKFALENIGFQNPLVLRPSNDDKVNPELNPGVDLYLQIQENGRWAMSSVESGSSEVINTHAEGSLSFMGPKATSSAAELRQLPLEEIRGRCPEEVEDSRMYVPFANIGLPLQPRFRTVRTIKRSEDEIIAWVAAQEDGTNAGFVFGPAVIDGSFQASCAFQNLEALPSLRIPLSIDRVQILGQGFSQKVWVHHVLLENGEKQMETNVQLARDDLTIVMTMDRMRLREVRPEHIAKMLAASAGDADEDLLEVAWVPLEKAPAQADAAEVPLFVGATELQPALAAEFPGAGFVDGTKEALEQKLKEPGFTAILHVAALEDCPEMEALQSALYLAQAAMQKTADKSTVPGIWWVTKGTQDQVTRSYLHAGLWGLARTFRMEERSVQLRCLDLDGSLETKEALCGELKEWLRKLKGTEVETEVAVASGEANVSRLQRASAVPLKAQELLMSSRGSLSNLRPVLQETRKPPSSMEAEIRVRAVGLNFRDVLNVMGLYPGDPGPPGADSAGTVLSVGSEITHIRRGDDVFGESPGCLRTYNSGKAALLSPKPRSWSFEEACCMPVIFVTVEEALGDLAQLKKGEKVLIHAAAGGVGLVAIQYAQFVGAEVFATAGADEKHEFLRSLGVKYITSSRNGAKFEEDMKSFLKELGGDGIDVVLNSLSHDDYIGRSLALLKPGGRFMEIGKRGIWSHQQMFEARPDVMYEKIAADTMMDLEQWRYNAYMKRLVDRVDAGGLVPINMHIFEGMEQGVTAMQFLQRAKNIGKVVISQASTLNLKPEGHYVLSGGMGALGMVTAQYLLEEGAKSMTLLSRSGKPSADITDLWAQLQDSSVELQAASCDIASMDAVRQLQVALKDKNLAGLIHLAAVLDDATMPKLTRGHLERSYGAKVWGARHLRSGLFSEKGWDFALLFSSTSALLGSPGQGNYSAANAALDAHARYWKKVKEENVVSVQWGPWREVGMAAQKGTVERLRQSGVGSLSNAFGMAALAGCLKAPLCTTLVVQPMRWALHL
ncbi:unnamed protein product, partial [Effrenium voratum]